MKVKAIISALMLMACGMASAQTKTYLNVETAPGVYKSFEVNENLKISWGEKKELPPSTGTEKRTGNIDVNWVQLWEDGPKFAEYNLGAANNKAEDYGGYYAWGGSQDKVDDHKTGTDALSGDSDTATQLWGDNWRMPTKAEFEALLANCTVEWTNVNGVDGRKFTGKGDYLSNSVFLPAAGYCNGGNVYSQGLNGRFWSSTPSGSDYAYDLYVGSGSQSVEDYNRYRRHGYSVRAVLAE